MSATKHWTLLYCSSKQECKLSCQRALQTPACVTEMSLTIYNNISVALLLSVYICYATINGSKVLLSCFKLWCHFKEMYSSFLSEMHTYSRIWSSGRKSLYFSTNICTTSIGCNDSSVVRSREAYSQVQAIVTVNSLDTKLFLPQCHTNAMINVLLVWHIAITKNRVQYKFSNCGLCLWSPQVHIRL